MQNEFKNLYLNSQALDQQLKSSIKMVKKFKEAMKMKLKLWKSYYTFEDILNIMHNTDEITKELGYYNITLSYKIDSQIIVLQSNIDPCLKVSEKFFDNLLTTKAFNWSKKIQEEYKKYVQNSKSKNTT